MGGGASAHIPHLGRDHSHGSSCTCAQHPQSPRLEDSILALNATLGDGDFSPSAEQKTTHRWSKELAEVIQWQWGNWDLSPGLFGS